MNWGKLGKRFARECAQNRAKTGILGGLLLVALYMWAPLVLGFFKSPPKSTATEQTTGSTAEPVPIEETLASLPSAAAETTWDWQKLLAALCKHFKQIMERLDAGSRDHIDALGHPAFFERVPDGFVDHWPYTLIHLACFDDQAASRERFL